MGSQTKVANRQLQDVRIDLADLQRVGIILAADSSSLSGRT